MRWIIPLGTGGVILVPLVVVSIVSQISPYFILDNPDFWYGYMGYIGTVALAGAALWQNQSFRLENKRKEEYAIRPYLFSRIKNHPLTTLVDDNLQELQYLQICINKECSVSILPTGASRPEDISRFTIAEIVKRYAKEYFGEYKRKSVLEDKEDWEDLEDLRDILSLINKYFVFSYCLENHGIGSAVKIRVSLNEYQLIPLFCLSHMEKQEIYFLVNAEELNVGQVAKVNITIEFYNVEDFGPYVQKDEFFICRTFGNKFDKQFTLIVNQQTSSPVLVKKEATTDDKT